MIWGSILAMTVVDVLIVGVVSYSLAIFLKFRAHITMRNQRGFAVIILGLSLVALFYLADLLTMHALPLFVPMSAAMAIMQDLHLNHGWFVVLLGIGAISFGLATANRGVFSLVGELSASEQALKDELASRQLAEQALQERVAELESAKLAIEDQSKVVTRMAEDLALTCDQAQAADRAKTAFLANMSHELRTPLNAIIGFSETIKRETFGPVGSNKYREYADDIHASGLHLLELVNDILDLSKIESETEELREENIEIPEILRAVQSLVQGSAEKGGVEFDMDVSEWLPPLCVGSRKLKQILANLLSNAIKFTEPGGRVTLRAWCQESSGFIFQVVDTGIGIALEGIPKALAPFQQIDNELNRKYEGTGLGLPLAKSLAELHGGSLDLQSRLGFGTTVTVRFPAERIVRSAYDTEVLGALENKAG